MHCVTVGWAVLTRRPGCSFREVQGNQFDAAFDGAILPSTVKALGRNGRCHLID